MKNIANYISISRIVMSVLLIITKTFSIPFYIVYVYCGLSDIATFKIGQAYDVIRDEINEEFDLIFIDANKQEYIKFFEVTHPLLKKGGVILADNITSHAKKVEDFVQAISSHPEYQVQILDLPDGLLMAYKHKE